MAKSGESGRRTSSRKPVQPGNIKKKAFPIVGIGASAGGLEAFKELLRALPDDTGMAFILVQHLDPTHKSLAPEILSHLTGMPVHEVTDGMEVEANHVYTIPSNFDMAIRGHILILHLPSPRARGAHLVINSFFQSLAQGQRERAIGVILSGTASDGAEGLRSIKSAGGLAIAQDPKTAKYSGMPESAIASGIVDWILSPSEIARELARISKHPYVVAACEAAAGVEATTGDEEPDDGVQSEPSDALREIFMMLRAKRKVDFSAYKQSTIMRRIQRRMMVQQSKNLEAYTAYLKDNPKELDSLFSDILIHVTQFFRDPKSLRALQELVFPQLMKNRNPGAPIRVWVPGCSTGEEAYSIALSLLESQNELGARTPIQVFATDLSEQAIQRARSGIYPKAIESAVSRERLDHFFQKVDGGYKINKDVRDLCLFSVQDVTSDPPFSKLDLISCRNVLIYFSAALQARLMPVFHYALKRGGFLFLGGAENMGRHSNLFSLLDKTHKIYSRVDIQTPMPLRSARVHEPDSPGIPAAAHPQTSVGGGFRRDAERVALARYAPPSVIVNADMEILQFLGRTAPYLEPVSGAPTHNLFKMARQEVLPGLRATVQSATKSNSTARREGLSFEVDGKRRYVNIEVVPVNPLAAANERDYMIFFEEAPRLPPPRSAGKPLGRKSGGMRTILDERARRIAELEGDFSVSKESQRALTEEFNVFQEELTSANEELQSANEELQSTNEELETSKEELQSSIEELTTVNDELQIRNSDLSVLSGDLNNILNNVDVPIVIVGNNRQIRRFTPSAQVFFNLIPGDVGRPLGHIKPRFELDLEAMVSRTIQSLRPQEGEVRIDRNRWMRLQVQPYRTIDDRIDGAVITLVDITALKEGLAEKQVTLENATSISDTLRLPLVVLDAQLRILSANADFARMFDVLPHKDLGLDLPGTLDKKRWRIPRLRELLSEAATRDKDLVDLEFEDDLPDLGHRVLLLNTRPIHWRSVGMPKALLFTIEDITRRRMLEASLEHSEKRFRTVVESAYDSILLVTGAGIIEFANRRALAYFGYGAGELEGKPLNTLIPDYRSPCRGRERRSLADPGSRSDLAGLELTARRKDGSEFPVDVSLSPIETHGGTQVTAIIRDISETRRVSMERKALLEQEQVARVLADEAAAAAQRANTAKDEFLATLSHELRTPLSSILSWSQLILRSNLDQGKLQRGMKTIEQSARRQGQLIDDLLDVARIQSGKLSTHFAAVDLREPVMLAIEGARPIAESKRIVLESEMKLDPAIIWGDAERLQQIMSNLLTNAIKFSSEKGTVRVLVEPVEEAGEPFISIRVIDQGKGMEPEFLPKLFRRFSQADSSSIRVHGGLGLGLSLVRDLTHLHHGTVRAQSEGPGKGSTFTVLLPVGSESSIRSSSPPGSEEVHARTRRPDLLGLRVMIVEDDPGTMEAISETLIAFGAGTLCCTTVAEAVDGLKRDKPDVLVSDIAMAGEDGYSLIRRIREAGYGGNGGIPSLALSAYASEQDVKRALSAGFDAHMAKPFDNFRLGQAVARLARKGESISAGEESGNGT